MSAGFVLAIIYYLHVLHVIRHQIVHDLVIGLCRKAEGSVCHAEPIVEGTHDVDASLALDLLVQRDDGLSVDCRRVAQFLVERCLVVKTCRQTKGDILVEGRDSRQRDTWRHDGLLVVAPVGQTHAVVQCEIPGFLALALESVGVLQISLNARALQRVLRSQRVDEVQPVAGVGNAVSAGVAHLIFAGLLLYLLPLEGETCLHVVLLGFVVRHQLDALHVCRQVVACMFHVSSHTQLLLCLCVVQPILSLNIIRLLFLRVEGRSQ